MYRWYNAPLGEVIIDDSVSITVICPKTLEQSQVSRYIFFFVKRLEIRRQICTSRVTVH